MAKLNPIVLLGGAAAVVLIASGKKKKGTSDKGRFDIAFAVMENPTEANVDKLFRNLSPTFKAYLQEHAKAAGMTYEDFAEAARSQPWTIRSMADVTMHFADPGYEGWWRDYPHSEKGIARAQELLHSAIIAKDLVVPSEFGDQISELCQRIKGPEAAKLRWSSCMLEAFSIIARMNPDQPWGDAPLPPYDWEPHRPVRG